MNTMICQKCDAECEAVELPNSCGVYACFCEECENVQVMEAVSDQLFVECDCGNDVPIFEDQQEPGKWYTECPHCGSCNEYLEKVE